MRGLVAIGVLLVLMALPPEALSQPSELYKCVSWGRRGEPNCGLAGGVSVLGECGYFQTYGGRAAWYPLRNEGPVTIELSTFASYYVHFPVFIEIVPLPEAPTPSFCLEEHPGLLVGVARGSLRCGGIWEKFGPIAPINIVPRGGLYAVRLQFFQTIDLLNSPGIDCIRVSRYHKTAVEATSWSQVKSLYKE